MLSQSASQTSDILQWGMAFVLTAPYYFIPMKYPSESAIQNHFMDSVLPHPSYPQPKQFLKTKEFYRPEQPIWNNPHRASPQMYQFYHAYNDQYQRKQAPLLQQLQERDRQQAEQERIQRLIAFRNRTREGLQQKQRQREAIEEKVWQDGSGRNIKTEHSLAPNQPSGRAFSTIKSLGGGAGSRSVGKSKGLARMEADYEAGLRKYDQRREQINQLISTQTGEFHSKVRSSFLARKQGNDTTNSQFYPNSHKTIRH